uniref:Uncharacterized protein n=1 Tax=Daphnia galeata TaxID=27404 RepID=A0A8J2RB05_9CRUS|nr:unnamed protein product [Daphnia galeata]
MLIPSYFLGTTQLVLIAHHSSCHSYLITLIHDYIQQSDYNFLQSFQEFSQLSSLLLTIVSHLSFISRSCTYIYTSVHLVIVSSRSSFQLATASRWYGIMADNTQPKPDEEITLISDQIDTLTNTRGSRGAIQGLIPYLKDILLRTSRLQTEITTLEVDEEEAERQDTKHLTYITRAGESMAAAQDYLMSR